MKGTFRSSLTTKNELFKAIVVGEESPTLLSLRKRLTGVHIKSWRDCIEACVYIQIHRKTIDGAYLGSTGFTRKQFLFQKKFYEERVVPCETI